jgi:hypothetical protein
MKLSRMRCTGYVRMDWMRNEYKILVRKMKGKREFGWRRHICEVIITINLKGRSSKGVDWIQLAQYRGQWRIHLCTVMCHRFPQENNKFSQPSDCQLLSKVSAEWSSFSYCKIRYTVLFSFLLHASSYRGSCCRGGDMPQEVDFYSFAQVVTAAWLRLDLLFYSNFYTHGNSLRATVPSASFKAPPQPGDVLSLMRASLEFSFSEGHHHVSQGQAVVEFIKRIKDVRVFHKER